jgi:Ca2+-binding EF-hand superfamily protein
VVLDFQLQEHEKFLGRFTELFKHVDEDSNGIIDENQFRELITQMGVVEYQEDVEALL